MENILNDKRLTKKEPSEKSSFMFSLTLFIFIFTFIQSHTFHIYISFHSAHSSVAHIKLHCPHNRCPIVSLSVLPSLCKTKKANAETKRRTTRQRSVFVIVVDHLWIYESERMLCCGHCCCYRYRHRSFSTFIRDEWRWHGFMGVWESEIARMHVCYLCMKLKGSVWHILGDYRERAL